MSEEVWRPSVSLSITSPHRGLCQCHWRGHSREAEYVQCFCVLASLVQRGGGSDDEKGPPLGKCYGLGLNVIFNVLAMRSLYLLSCCVVSSASLLCETPVCIEFSIVA